jgi:membrane fusion protein (multidrug efflux system)
MNEQFSRNLNISAINLGAAALATILTAVLVAGCSAKGPGGFSMPPMPVEVAVATSQRVSDRFEAIGTIEAIEAITVVSEIDGAIVKLPFEEGSLIRKGAIIAQIDDSQLAAELSRAEALRDQSKVNYDRVKSVVDQQAGAAQDLDDAASSLKVAEANLALARARFSKTRITAPFDGSIGARRVSVGTFIRTGQMIAELANIDEIRVNFTAPERVLPLVTRGAEVSVSTTAYAGYSLKGKIMAVEPVLDPGTRTARVVARVANTGRRFRPGMSANVSAVLSERPSAITIPNEAVFASGNQSFVFIVKPDSTASRVPVTLGTRLADVVEVVGGLQAGAQVVRAGHQKLFDGAKVMPVPSQQAPPSH